MSETQAFTLKDGRNLSYATFGAPAGAEQAAVFYFHGTPGSHYEGRALHKAASKEKLRVIAITRPGFGASTVQPNRSILSFPQDVLALADHLGILRFAVLGVSGGGPYVLACVHDVPPMRLLAATVVAGLYPLELGTGGMMLGNRILLSLVPWAPGLVAFGMDRLMGGKLARDDAHPEKFTEVMKNLSKGLPAEDQAAMMAEDGKILDIAVESARDGFRQGSRSAAEELRLFASPWGFELTDLRIGKARLTLWHGAKDVNIPVTMAEKAARIIPGAELRVVEGLAHLSLSVRKVDEIITLLAETLKES